MLTDILEAVRMLNAVLSVVGVVGVIAAHVIYARQVDPADRVRAKMLNAIATGCVVFGIGTVDAMMTDGPVTYKTLLTMLALLVFIWAAVAAARDRSHGSNLTAFRRSIDRQESHYEHR